MSRQLRRMAIKARRLRGSWEWERQQIDPEARARHPACRNVKAVYTNDTYIVQVYDVATEWGTVEHLIVRRNDSQPVRAWYDLQRIKNELCGPERVAVEVFPRESQLKDEANLYHLWVLPEGAELPFGLHRENGLQSG